MADEAFFGIRFKMDVNKLPAVCCTLLAGWALLNMSPAFAASESNAQINKPSIPQDVNTQTQMILQRLQLMNSQAKVLHEGPLSVRTSIDGRPSLPSNSNASPSFTNTGPSYAQITLKNGARLWNLRNVDILSVISEVSKETGKNFVVDPRVSGKVTIVSSRPMVADEIYQVFLAMLQTNGFSAVPSGNVIKIVPDLDAKRLGGMIASNAHPGKGDEIAVRVIPVKSVSAVQLSQILRPMLPEWADISVYAPTNILILSGRASSIENLVGVIERVDMANKAGVEIVPIHYASAADLASEINSLQQAAKADNSTPLVSVVADERSNSLLLSGNLTARQNIHTLISRLDIPNTNSANTTQVIYLHYLKAKELLPVLNGILGGSAAASNAGSTTSDDKSTSTPTTTYTSSTSKAQIQAEPSANAIIISAPPALMQSLKNVIAKLDVRPAQVLVEAIVVEVSQQEMQQLGIQWGTKLRTVSAAGLTLPNSDNGFSTIAGGLGVGIIESGVFRELITALATNSSTNVLSTPSLVVLDNQAAKIAIGQKLSTTTGSYPVNSTGSAVQPFTTTNYTEVALHLNVTPQINRGNSVLLKIDQGDDAPAGTVGSSGNPNINTSSIKTSVMINSGQILVLGGLIKKDVEETDQKVPILGDVPVVGKVFHNKNKSLVNKNLLVFLRPTIMHEANDGANLTSDHYKMMQELQTAQFQTRAHGPDYEENAVLPDWDSVAKTSPVGGRQAPIKAHPESHNS